MNNKLIITFIVLMLPLSANCADNNYRLFYVFLPIIRAHAEYPQEAVNKDIVGFCSAIFDVTVTGTVTNQRIIKCNVEGYFEESVVKAISQFKYKAPLPYQVIGVIEFFWFSTEINSNYSHYKNLGVHNSIYCDRSSKECKAYLSELVQEQCSGC